MPVRVLNVGLPRLQFNDPVSPVSEGIAGAANTLLQLGPQLKQIELEKQRIAEEQRRYDEDVALRRQQMQESQADREYRRKADERDYELRKDAQTQANLLQQNKFNAEYHEVPGIANLLAIPESAPTTDVPMATGPLPLLQGFRKRPTLIDPLRERELAIEQQRADAATAQANAAQQRVSLMQQKLDSVISNPRLPDAVKIKYQSLMRLASEAMGTFNTDGAMKLMEQADALLATPAGIGDVPPVQAAPTTGVRPSGATYEILP